MFNNISERIADNLIENGTISSEDKSTYQFGIKQGFTIGLNILSSLVIALIFQMIIEPFLFLAVYIPLRKFAGGIHAKTPIRCYIYSNLMIVAILLVIRFFHFGNFICDIISIISSIPIFIFAPVDTPKRRLDDIEKKVFRKRTIIILASELLVQLALSFILDENIIMTFSLSFISVATVMIIGLIKKSE